MKLKKILLVSVASIMLVAQPLSVMSAYACTHPNVVPKVYTGGSKTTSSWHQHVMEDADKFGNVVTKPCQVTIRSELWQYRCSSCDMNFGERWRSESPIHHIQY
jgi:hypothetical protein